MSAVAPVLVIAVGNPSRGDDALGPRLAERLEAEARPGVEVITDYQLQIEHALDLEGRERVVFVDAAVGIRVACELRPVRPQDDFRHTTHALSPPAVLATWVRVQRRPPPEAWSLAVRGESFELGEGLSPGAARNLEAAWGVLGSLLDR